MRANLTRLLLGIGLIVAFSQSAMGQSSSDKDYHRARWDKLHFKPAISQATNAQCLACHQEILKRKPLEQSPAGVKASEAKAWYETLDTYTGPQETFHRRHLVTDYAKSVMDLKCTTCHEGNDPRDETSGTSATTQAGLTMRKMVDPYVCALCHGQYNAKKMGVPGPWLEKSAMFGDSCLTCHAGIKTERHKGVSFLKAKAIEAAGKKDSDVCYGCHGGRAWYRIPFPYADKHWPGWGDPPAGLAKKYPKKPAQQAKQ